MKIYGGRYNSDKEILDSLVGKDAWVKVSIGRYSDKEYVMRVFRTTASNYGDIYDVVYLPAEYLNSQGVYPIHESIFSLYQGPDDRLYADDIYIIKPVEIYTTDEVFLIFDDDEDIDEGYLE